VLLPGPGLADPHMGGISMENRTPTLDVSAQVEDLRDLERELAGIQRQIDKIRDSIAFRWSAVEQI
jgi:hypothetical protein